MYNILCFFVIAISFIARSGSQNSRSQHNLLHILSQGSLRLALPIAVKKVTHVSLGMNCTKLQECKALTFLTHGDVL